MQFQVFSYPERDTL